MFSHPINPRPAATIAPQLLEFATELAQQCAANGSVTIAKGSAEHVALMAMLALVSRQRVSTPTHHNA